MEYERSQSQLPNLCDLVQDPNRLLNQSKRIQPHTAGDADVYVQQDCGSELDNRRARRKAAVVSRLCLLVGERRGEEMGNVWGVYISKFTLKS